MEQRYSDLQACAITPNAALVIVDVDEVLAQFMRGFGDFIARHGFELRVDRFALFQNIYRPGETEHLDLIAGKALFDDFFRDGADDLLPAIGAADALADLSTRAEVVILTNAPTGAEARPYMDFVSLVGKMPAPWARGFYKMKITLAAEAVLFLKDGLVVYWGAPSTDEEIVQAKAGRLERVLNDPRLGGAAPERVRFVDDRRLAVKLKKETL